MDIFWRNCFYLLKIVNLINLSVCFYIRKLLLEITVFGKTLHRTKIFKYCHNRYLLFLDKSIYNLKEEFESMKRCTINLWLKSLFYNFLKLLNEKVLFIQ